VPENKSACPWYLYLIETKYKAWYTGITKDWQRRFDEHASNSVKSAKALRGKGPLRLVFCVQLKDHSTALQAEIWLKKQNKVRKQEVAKQQSSFPFDHEVIEIRPTEPN
jgi:putative endonuclease